jgi:hypothetical protein
MAANSSAYIIRPDDFVESRNGYAIRPNDIVFLPYFKKDDSSGLEPRWGHFLNYTPREVARMLAQDCNPIRALRVVEFVQTQNIDDGRTIPNNTRIICQLLTAEQLRESNSVNQPCRFTEEAIRVMTKENSETLQQFTNKLRKTRSSTTEPIENFLVDRTAYIAGVENTTLLPIQTVFLKTLHECPMQLTKHDYDIYKHEQQMQFVLEERREHEQQYSLAHLDPHELVDYWQQHHLDQQNPDPNERSFFHGQYNVLPLIPNRW